MEKREILIGMGVRFIPPSAHHPTAYNEAQVVPAVVTSVHGDLVNLTVFADGREPVPVANVEHSLKGLPGTYHWHDEVGDLEKEKVNSENSGTGSQSPADSEEGKSKTQE